MKLTKLFYSITLLFISGPFSFGQIDQGLWRIGPTFEYQSTRSEIDGLALDISSSSLSIGLSGGYFIKDNLEIGAGVFTSSRTSEVGTLETSTRGFFIGPSITYMVQLGDEFYMPILGGFGFNTVTEDNDGFESSFSGIGFGIGAGIEYIIDSILGARITLGYDFGSLNDNDSRAQIELRDFGVRISVNYYFF